MNQIALKVCSEYQIPYITGTIGPNFGRVGPFFDQPTDMLNFLENTEYWEEQKNIKVIKSILGSQKPSKCIVSILVAYDAVRFLLKERPSSYKKILYVAFK